MNRCMLGKVEVLPILLLTIGLRVRKILVIVVYAHKIMNRSVGENKNASVMYYFHIAMLFMKHRFLDYLCTNDQTECEALLFGLQN
jgi:hypothetical protein